MWVFRNEKYTTTKEGNLICSALMHISRLTSKCTCHPPSEAGPSLSISLSTTVKQSCPLRKKSTDKTLAKGKMRECFLVPNTPLPLISGPLSLSTHSQGMFGGPVPYFVCTMHSCRVFIYVNLAFDHRPLTHSVPVSEKTHLWGSSQGSGFLGKFTVN